MSEDNAADWKRLIEDNTDALAQAKVATERSQAILLTFAAIRERELDVRELEASAAQARARADLAMVEAEARRRAELAAEAATWHSRIWEAARAGFASGPVQTVIAALAAAMTLAIGWYAARWNTPGGTP